MNLHTLLRKLLLVTTLVSLSACGGGGGGSAEDSDNGDGSTNGGGGTNSSVSWQIGGQSYIATSVTDAQTYDTPNIPPFAAISLKATDNSSNISITHTLSGPGSYYISGQPGSVATDEENPVYTKRIAILLDQRDPSAEFGFNFYITTEDSGFVDVTVDNTGRYYFNIPSTNPITLLESSGSNNTIDFSMIDVHDFR